MRVDKEEMSADFHADIALPISCISKRHVLLLFLSTTKRRISLSRVEALKLKIQDERVYVCGLGVFIFIYTEWVTSKMLHPSE